MSKLVKNPETLLAALVKAQAEFTAPPKSGTANATASRQYHYAPLDVVIGHVRDTLGKHGLGFYQTVEGEAGSVTIGTVLIHSSGEQLHTGSLTFSAPDPQKAGSAITYARRYSLLAALGISPIDEDDDAQATKIDATTSKGSATVKGPTAAQKRVFAEMKDFAKEQGIDPKAVSEDFREYVRSVHGVESSADVTPKQLAEAWSEYQKENRDE